MIERIYDLLITQDRWTKRAWNKGDCFCLVGAIAELSGVEKPWKMGDSQVVNRLYVLIMRHYRHVIQDTLDGCALLKYVISATGALVTFNDKCTKDELKSLLEMAR